MRWPRRSMFIWQLRPAIEAEGSPDAVVSKALAAGVDGLLVKIAEGAFAYRNTEGETGRELADLRKACRLGGISMWGWHVPRCAAPAGAPIEAERVEQLARHFDLDGLIMNAEPGERFFQGDRAAANAYGREMRAVADRLGRPLGICSLALPASEPSWAERLASIAAWADINLPQIYYGATPVVADFLAAAEAANADFGLPMLPVGAAWVGGDGGCVSALDCASRARDFIELCSKRDYPGHAFWHWAQAPPEFWNVLKATKI